jgi:hypothetical protein
MPRITHVAKAQQRYETKPVIDPATGVQKVTPVLRKDGSPKMTRSKPNRPGRPIVLRVTEADKSQPLPLLSCGFCHKPIEIGTPYKHMSPKSGPYGGRQLNRHEACPTWNVWDYSNSMSARIAQMEHDFQEALGAAQDSDDVTSALQEMAEAVRELAAEKEEAGQNIEDGFQHETEQSTELKDIAEQLESWADDIENADVPDFPEPEEEDCDECGGTGHVDDVDSPEYSDTQNVLPSEIPQVDCDNCDGTGQVTPDEPTEDQIDAWREEVEDAVSITGECPV